MVSNVDDANILRTIQEDINAILANSYINLRIITGDFQFFSVSTWDA